MIRTISAIMIGLLFSLLSEPASADEFDPYREYIDNYQNYSPAQREKGIHELESLKTGNIEKNYLLGMLYFLQGVDAMTSSAHAKKEKLKAEEGLKEPAVRGYLERSEQNYEVVEKAQPGYKYIYCKFAELYRYSFNMDGLRKVTSQIGKIGQNDRISQCKSAIEDIAEGFASHGYASISRAIYEEAVKSWTPYPKYMLEALGDIANIQEDTGQSLYWWKRCVDEAEKVDRKKRCEDKLRGPAH